MEKCYEEKFRQEAIQIEKEQVKSQEEEEMKWREIREKNCYCKYIKEHGYLKKYRNWKMNT